MTQNITDIIVRIHKDKIKLGITLYDKAELKDIANFEKIMQVTLPADLRSFYSFSNGFESAEDMFRLLPLDDIIDNKRNGRDTQLINTSDFHFAEYMTYCDMWTLSVNQQDNKDYFIYNKTEDVVTLTHSFVEFLDVFLTGGVFDGLYNWRKRIQKTTN